jgi:outer membrane protein OmpA-like peptidoglycan-associated protein
MRSRPSRSPAAHLPRGPTGAGTPVGPGMPAMESPALSQTRCSMSTLAFYQLFAAQGTAARRRRRMIATAAGVAVLPLAVLLAGCGPPPGSPKTIVIVASATMNEPGPVLAAPDLTLLRNAATTSSSATAFVVSPNTGQAREVSLTPRRADGQVDYGPERGRELAANVQRVQRLLGQVSATEPFDLLSMIAQAVRVTSHPGTLLVLSSGLSTAGRFDLRQVGWGANPRAVAIALRRGRFLPSLTGWHVVFSGLGDTAGRQPAPPLPQRTELTRYWLAICQAAGAATCAADSVTRPDPPARSTTPVPVVRFPRVTSLRGPHGRTRTYVPADEFFAFDSHRLLPGANAVLGPMAAKATRQRLKVTIVGYASPDGGTALYNRALSAKRAKAVQARLIALGVPARMIVKVVGLGLDGKTRAACLRHGQLDKAVCSRLRRVEITLSPARAATP